MFTDRLSREFEDGVESFLQYALQNARDPNLISCPCAKCMNLKRKNTTTIKAHLCCHGMDLMYERWIWHGEKVRSTNIVNEGVEMGQSDQLDEVEDHIEMVPCNVGYHWILTVIDPHKEVVYLLDSLSHRIRDGSWKNVVDMAINVFNATLGRKRKKHPSWEIIKCLIQPDSKQCGFYVMRFVKEIIEGLSTSGSNSIKSMFKKDPYSEDVEIDEVRKEWANCVLEYI